MSAENDTQPRLLPTISMESAVTAFNIKESIECVSFGC